MFHEPYYPFTLWPPHLNVLAAANRLMAVLLLSDIRVAYVSTTAWQRRLSKYAPRTRQFVWLPIPSSIPVADAAATVRWRERLGGPGARVVGHFGTFGRLVSRLLGPALVRLLEQRSDVSIALIGPDGDAFAAELCTGRNDWRRRIFATGRLDAAEVAGCIAACDLMLQPYADGASGRRTTLMAAMVNGKATVTNRGAATEAVWDGSDAVCFAASRRPSALVSAVERLLDDDGERERVGAAGATLYARQFALAHSIRILRGDREGAA
jgi:glycosyltransferase involved in cell wall biosynthesis